MGMYRCLICTYYFHNQCVCLYVGNSKMQLSTLTCSTVAVAEWPLATLLDCTCTLYPHNTLVGYVYIFLAMAISKHMKCCHVSLPRCIYCINYRTTIWIQLPQYCTVSLLQGVASKSSKSSVLSRGSVCIIAHQYGMVWMSSCVNIYFCLLIHTCTYKEIIWH